MLQKPVWFADLAIASGLMVRRELVESIGLPRTDFFMDFFDFEYCLRARSHGYGIAVVSSVRLAHEVGDAREVRLPGYFALWPNHAPWREYYMSLEPGLRGLVAVSERPDQALRGRSYAAPRLRIDAVWFGKICLREENGTGILRRPAGPAGRSLPAP